MLIKIVCFVKKLLDFKLLLRVIKGKYKEIVNRFR